MVPENGPSDDEFPKILKTKSISDRQYELVQRLCPRCETVHFEVFRFSGASFSRYHLDESFSEENFDSFVEDIDEMLLQSAADLIEDFLRTLQEKNSEHGIEADWTFAFRLLEYGRHRTSKLSKLGMLDAIISRAEPKNKPQEAVRAAFELGMATAEHRLLDTYEHYLWDGIALSDWRETGLPMARAERLRRGKITHTAIVGAARRLYKKDPQLVRNDSETARQIVAMNLPELEKGAGIYVGIDAITRHLRHARKTKEL